MKKDDLEISIIGIILEQLIISSQNLEVDIGLDSHGYAKVNT